MNYDECPLLPDFTPDYNLIAEKAKTATVVHIQRAAATPSAMPV